MSISYLILGGVALVAGVLMWWHGSESRLGAFGGMLALLGIAAVVVSFVGPQETLARRYAAANLRQGYVLGFGLGAHLKQTQSNRRLVFLRTIPEDPRDAQTIEGLLAGLDGALTVVGELKVEAPDHPRAQASLFTKDRLAEIQATGADIVVSFVGLPVRLDQTDRVNLDATQELWQSPEYRRLQWVLPNPHADLPPGSFREGRVLAAVWEKVHPATPNQFPTYLEIEGAPSDLFDAWFELVTTEAEH